MVTHMSTTIPSVIEMHIKLHSVHSQPFLNARIPCPGHSIGWANIPIFVQAGLLVHQFKHCYICRQTISIADQNILVQSNQHLLSTAAHNTSFASGLRLQGVMIQSLQPNHSVKYISLNLLDQDKSQKHKRQT